MTALKPSEVLSKAADLIEPEKAWTQGYYAATAEGERCDPEDALAVCWCIYGAIDRVSGRDDENDVAYRARLAVDKALGRYAPFFNDDAGRTQAEVVTALRQASAFAASGGE